MTRHFLIGAASLAALAFAACGNNTDTALTTPGDTPAMDSAMADAEAVTRKAQDFVMQAGQAGVVEIRTSEMALEKSTNAQVKAFAQKMIDQHKAAGDKLKAASAAAALAPPPDTLDDFHMRRINDLVETDGDEDFDADYAALQVDAHNDAIKLFEDYSKDSQANPQLKALADELLPTLTAHKAEAEALREAITQSASNATPT